MGLVRWSVAPVLDYYAGSVDKESGLKSPPESCGCPRGVRRKLRCLLLVYEV